MELDHRDHNKQSKEGHGAAIEDERTVCEIGEYDK